jgi:glycosyltransferase involved in cell wall biosynthesis
VSDELPLVTLVVLAYNQEGYVEEAVAAAFAQDYQNLEIILSDDCSSDKTFQLMQKMTIEYDGLHAVRLNRNQINLNIGAHMSTVNSLANGELIVAAAGDDVSMPHRVSTLVRAWLADNKRAGVIHSKYVGIRPSGERVELTSVHRSSLNSIKTVAAEGLTVVGATEAWDRQMFNFFGVLLEGIIHEDRALPFRALLLGRSILFVEEVLLLRRLGVGISAAYGRRSSANDPAFRILLLTRAHRDVEQRLHDLHKVPDAELNRILMHVKYRYEVALEFENGFPTPLRWIYCVKRVGLVHTLRMTLKRAVRALSN